MDERDEVEILEYDKCFVLYYVVSEASEIVFANPPHLSELEKSFNVLGLVMGFHGYHSSFFGDGAPSNDPKIFAMGPLKFAILKDNDHFLITSGRLQETDHSLFYRLQFVLDFLYFNFGSIHSFRKVHESKVEEEINFLIKQNASFRLSESAVLSSLSHPKPSPTYKKKKKVA